MLNLCGIVASILKMATGRNFSMSGHHYLPTYQILMISDNVEFLRHCGGHPEICRGQVHGPRKERRKRKRKRKRRIIIIIIIRNGAKTISLGDLTTIRSRLQWPLYYVLIINNRIIIKMITILIISL